MSVRVKCVHCGTRVHEFASECPYCNRPVANKDAPVNLTDAPWQKRNISYGRDYTFIQAAAIIIVVTAAALAFVLI